ncbi:MAG: four helix bundle protein [Polyangiaceae bacterium]|nr:four helix bundle protein [Polyangiaceae bacterium]
MRSHEQKERCEMLRIYPITVETMRELRPFIERIERKDGDLCRQMRKAASSVVLNMSEGMGSRGKLRQVRYHTALGSARETLACLEVAQAFSGWSAHPEVDADIRARLDRIIGTLVRLV